MAAYGEKRRCRKKPARSPGVKKYAEPAGTVLPYPIIPAFEKAALMVACRVEALVTGNSSENDTGPISVTRQAISACQARFLGMLMVVLSSVRVPKTGIPLMVGSVLAGVFAMPHKSATSNRFKTSGCSATALEMLKETRKRLKRKRDR